MCVLVDLLYVFGVCLSTGLVLLPLEMKKNAAQGAAAGAVALLVAAEAVLVQEAALDLALALAPPETDAEMTGVKIALLPVNKIGVMGIGNVIIAVHTTSRPVLHALNVANPRRAVVAAVLLLLEVMEAVIAVAMEVVTEAMTVVVMVVVVVAMAVAAIAMVEVETATAAAAATATAVAVIAMEVAVTVMAVVVIAMEVAVTVTAVVVVTVMEVVVVVAVVVATIVLLALLLNSGLVIGIVIAAKLIISQQRLLASAAVLPSLKCRQLLTGCIHSVILS